MNRNYEDLKSISGMKNHFIYYAKNNKVNFNYFITASFDKYQYHNDIRSNLIGEYHKRILMSATKYTNRKWIHEQENEPTVLSIIERNDKNGNSVFPHIHTLIEIDSKFENNYIQNMKFYSEKYGRKLLGTIPDLLIKRVDDQNRIIGYMTKNMDLNFDLQHDLVVRGKIYPKEIN